MIDFIINTFLVQQSGPYVNLEITLGMLEYGKTMVEDGFEIFYYENDMKALNELILFVRSLIAIENKAKLAADYTESKDVLVAEYHFLMKDLTVNYSKLSIEVRSYSFAWFRKMEDFLKQVLFSE